MSDKRRDLKKTARMPDAPALPKDARAAETLLDDPPPMTSKPKPKATDEQAVEVVVVREDAISDAPRTPWRAYEIWTMNRVYGLDATFKCIEVLDRTTGKLETEN